jgi:hypothetical protein
MRVTRVGLTAAFSAAPFGATTLDTAQAADAAKIRLTMSAVMAVFLRSCR